MPSKKPTTKQKRKSILLPRGYLSWSQMTLYERSEDDYKRQYILGEEGYENKYMNFGGDFAEDIEKGESDDFITDMLIKTVKRYDSMEHKMSATLESTSGKIALYGLLDSFDENTKNFLEYKTGKTKWTQSKAEKHGQLMFYALMIWLKHKVIPSIELIWIPTEEKKGKLSVTGEQHSFKVEYGLKDLLVMAGRIIKVSKEIEQMYKTEIDNI